MLPHHQAFAGTDTNSRGAAHAARLLDGARRVFVLTGAGMSADSGLPTYRGIGGLYADGETEDGVAIEDALSGDMFNKDPALTWKYIHRIESACRGARPNAGHGVLARLQGRYDRLCVLTQNVDGLHTAAGSRDVIEMHGDIHRLRCTGCDHSTQVADFADIRTLPPTCCHCGSVVRPQAVLFGETLPLRALAHYETALAEGFDVIVAIGTTAVFPYIDQPFRDARADGIPAIEINPQETVISHLCTATVRLPAARALTAIERQLSG